MMDAKTITTWQMKPHFSDRESASSANAMDAGVREGCCAGDDIVSYRISWISFVYIYEQFGSKGSAMEMENLDILDGPKIAIL